MSFLLWCFVQWSNNLLCQGVKKHTCAGGQGYQLRCTRVLEGWWTPEWTQWKRHQGDEGTWYLRVFCYYRSAHTCLFPQQALSFANEASAGLDAFMNSLLSRTSKLHSLVADLRKNHSNDSSAQKSPSSMFVGCVYGYFMFFVRCPFKVHDRVVPEVRATLDRVWQACTPENKAWPEGFQQDATCSYLISYVYF